MFEGTYLDVIRVGSRWSVACANIHTKLLCWKYLHQAKPNQTVTYIRECVTYVIHH